MIIAEYRVVSHVHDAETGEQYVKMSRADDKAGHIRLSAPEFDKLKDGILYRITFTPVKETGTEE